MSRLFSVDLIKLAVVILSLNLAGQSATPQPLGGREQQAHSAAPLDRARELIREHKFVAALNEAKAAGGRLAGNYQPSYITAYALFRMGRMTEAEQQANAARTLAPEDKKPLVDRLLQLIHEQQKSNTPAGKFRYIGRRWAPRSPKGVVSRYTISSIVIEANGLGVERDMAPKIRRQDGSEVWGTKEVDPDYVITDGIVVYSHTLPDAHKNKRCGRFPLILKATAKGSNPANCDVVVSDMDAKKLLAANQYTHCLDNNDVIFVIDK